MGGERKVLSQQKAKIYMIYTWSSSLWFTLVIINVDSGASDWIKGLWSHTSEGGGCLSLKSGRSCDIVKSFAKPLSDLICMPDS